MPADGATGPGEDRLVSSLGETAVKWTDSILSDFAAVLKEVHTEESPLG